MDQKVRRPRTWLFRLGAIALGLVPFLIAEVSLRLADWPRTVSVDPYVDLHNLRPLFQPTMPGRMEIAPERLNLFQPAGFDLPKSQDSFRVFALGGSTTQGEPYSTETSFAKWLEIDLQAAAPERTLEVINCGGLSYASYRVAAILREVLDYQPDLIVIYTGHNEYLERRSYAGLELQSESAPWLHRMNGLKLVQLSRHLFGQSPRPRYAVKDPTELQAEVDALLDYQGGLADYSRGDDWLSGVPQHFAWNLQEMIAACERQGTPVLFVVPTSNLADCPPFKFEPAPDLSPSERERFEGLWESARGAQDPLEARRAAEAACDIDPGHAGVNYLLGRLLYERGEYAAAKEYLTAARDNDVCPLRAPSQLVQIVRDVVTSEEIPLFDAEQLFAKESPGEIVGKKWLIDHVHPTVEGHRFLGRALAEYCLERQLAPQSVTDWQLEADRLATRHLEELGEAYFQRGAQRLRGLQLWTQGRAKKVRGD